MRLTCRALYKYLCWFLFYFHCCFLACLCQCPIRCSVSFIVHVVRYSYRRRYFVFRIGFLFFLLYLFSCVWFSLLVKCSTPTRTRSHTFSPRFFASFFFIIWYFTVAAFLRWPLIYFVRQAKSKQEPKMKWKCARCASLVGRTIRRKKNQRESDEQNKKLSKEEKWSQRRKAEKNKSIIVLLHAFGSKQLANEHDDDEQKQNNNNNTTQKRRSKWIASVTHAW